MVNEKMEKIVADFSKLSDQECAFLIRENLLAALETDTNFEWELIAKMLNVGYELRENLCRFFDNALAQNEQKISGISVRDWLRRYQLRYPPEKIRLNSFFEFVAKSPEIQALNDMDKIRLLKILRIRDYLLISPIFDMEDQAISSILNLPMHLTQSFDEIRREAASINMEPENIPGLVSERTSLKESLQKFSKLGEQPITLSSIKIKSFDRPVRPSIRNWLYDYTSHLGQTGHSSMDRTNYLFRSENTMNLSSPEREKLGIILKSFDENTPLPINAGSQEVVFEELMRKPTPPTPQSPPTPSRPKTPPVNFIHHVERRPAQYNPPSSRSPQEPEKKPPSELFIKPYEKKEVAAKTEAPKSVQSPPPTPPSFGQIQDFSKSDSAKMEFVNPYPAPGTHATKFEEKSGNIANVSFSEGLSGPPAARVSARSVPKTGYSPAASLSPKITSPEPKPAISPQSAKPAYRQALPGKNIIRPHFGEESRLGKPEPRINGNLVDLREKQSE